jgi:hypothetical protein
MPKRKHGSTLEEDSGIDRSSIRRKTPGGKKQNALVLNNPL